MAVDYLGNIVWICPVLPGTSADVKIWDTVITGAVRALCTRCARAVRKRPLTMSLVMHLYELHACFALISSALVCVVVHPFL